VSNDPRLGRIVEALEATGWACELLDADWRLVWVSEQSKGLIGEPDDEALGIGLHTVEARQLPSWRRLLSDDAQLTWLTSNVPQMLVDDPHAAERIAEMLDPELRPAVLEAKPASGSTWTALVETTGVVPAIANVRYFGVRVYSPVGEPLCTVFVYGTDLPATLLALVGQGDRGMFERMARLAEPGKREAAVLFADMQSSGDVSRHLSSAAYFQLVHELFTELDRVVIDAGGIVGKHAGDGMSAFFLAEDAGSAAGSAAAALEAAVGVARAARDVDVQMNVGVHWGGMLYMGQLVTGGRLEVTALGDEVNECARIQEVARDGAVLASKALIERLDLEDARRQGIDPEQLQYRLVSEFPDAPEKAVRDAGAVPVAEVPVNSINKGSRE
jgi:class 3 adenylate cyclase